MLLENGRSREELIEWLVELAQETPRMVVGFDFSFSFPVWFLRELGIGSALEFWRVVADGQGEAWLHKDCEDARFWGKAGSRRTGKKPAEFCGEHAHRMLRRAETALKVRAEIADPLQAAKIAGIAPKSTFQMAGQALSGQHRCGGFRDCCGCGRLGLRCGRSINRGSAARANLGRWRSRSTRG
jgi:hypothetical protein